jgi:hypothetical protein
MRQPGTRDGNTIPSDFDVDRGPIDPHILTVTCRRCGFVLSFMRDHADPQTVRTEALRHILRHRPGRWHGLHPSQELG